MIKTIFLIKSETSPNGETFAVEGTGQEATSAALKQFPNDVVILHGFVIHNRVVIFDWNENNSI